MILQKWLDELHATHGEKDVVAFARSKLERAQRERLPAPIAAHALDSADDVRTIAAMLAGLPASLSSDLLQQLLIVFSLATDRLSELERKGVLARKTEAATPAA
jgi:hypothetical protein